MKVKITPVKEHVEPASRPRVFRCARFRKNGERLLAHSQWTIEPGVPLFEMQGILIMMPAQPALDE